MGDIFQPTLLDLKAVDCEGNGLHKNSTKNYACTALPTPISGY